MKMARCFNFQMILPYTLISTSLHFLIHNVLTCLLLGKGSFTCGAELERGRIPSHCLLEFQVPLKQLQVQNALERKETF